MYRDTPEGSQVDPDFQRWMKQFQERSFFANNLVFTSALGVMGATLPVMVNLLQQRPAYRRTSPALILPHSH